MAAFRRVYGFGHLQADCRGPGSALEPYAGSSMGLPLPYTHSISRRSVDLLHYYRNDKPMLLLIMAACQFYHYQKLSHYSIQDSTNIVSVNIF